MEKKSAQKIQPGHRYGRWVIVSAAERLGGDTRYVCRCDCGTERQVSAITLRNGTSTHCGCLKKDRPPKLFDFELRPTPPEIQEVFQLIRLGCLPPADQFSMTDGAPAWTLQSMARILGVSREEFLHHLERAGQRFAILPASGHAREVSLP